MLADEIGAAINLPTVAATAREIQSLDKWDGATVAFAPVSGGSAPKVSGSEAVLASHRLLLDLGTLQNGEANLAGTARSATANISQGRAATLGVAEGDLVQISTQRGSVTVPAHITEMDDSSVWIPRNSEGSQAIANLGNVSGEVVTVVKA